MSQSNDIKSNNAESDTTTNSTPNLTNNLKDLRQLREELVQQPSNGKHNANLSDPSVTSVPDDTQFDINESSYKTSHTAVRKARRFALQGLYEWLMTDYRFEQTGHGEWKSNAPHDIAARTRATNAMHTVHLGYYHEMMGEIPKQHTDLEAMIAQHLDRDISKLDLVERAVLLIGAYELKHSLHIPYKVVLDEAMKLNTHFGATDAHKLINAVLDKLASELRAVEVKADTGNQSKAKSKAQTTSSDKTASPQTTKGRQENSLNTDAEQTSNRQNQPNQNKPSKPRIGLKKGVGSVKAKPAKASTTAKTKQTER